MREAAIIIVGVAAIWIVVMVALMLGHPRKATLAQVTDANDWHVTRYAPCTLETPYGRLSADVNDGMWDLTDDSIRLLCKSGRVCRTMGHIWSVDAESDRHCSLCKMTWRARR